MGRFESLRTFGIVAVSLVTAAVASMPLPAAAQGTSGDKEEPEFIWPVAGQEAGDSILFKPQQYKA